MKLIFIILIIFSLNLSFAQDRPRCITTDNIYVNSKQTKPNNGEVSWWFLNQLINKDAIYTDSYLKDTNTVLEVEGYDTRGIIESPLYNTFKQSHDPTKYHSISYNDAISDEKFSTRLSALLEKKKTLAGSAHAKGFFIWNENGGIHVIHSFPQSPTVDETRFVPPKGGDQYSQHAMCVELSVDELGIIPKYLIYSNSNLQTIDNQRVKCWKRSEARECHVSLSLLEGVITGSDGIDRTVNSITDWDFTTVFDDDTQEELNGITTFDEMESFFKETILEDQFLRNDIGKWALIAYKIAGSEITSLSPYFSNAHYYKAMSHGPYGKYFVQTSNGHLRANYQTNRNNLFDIGFEIIWKYIRNYEDYEEVEDWISHTMTWDRGGADSMFKTEDGIHLVYKFQSESVQEIGNEETLKEISTTEDHSKLLYGTNSDNSFSVFCAGDLNWQGVQILRGGGAYCRTDLGYLVDFYIRKVSWFRSYDEDGDPNNYAILNSLFTTRSNYDLTWIKDGLKTKYRLYGIHLVEYTPSTNPEISFLLEPDYNTMLKLKVTKPDDYLSDDPVDVETEPFTLKVNPSIPEKVFICPINSPKCDLESAIRVEILKDVTLPIRYTIPNLSGKGFSSDDFAVTIEVNEPNPLVWILSDILQDYVNCASITERYVDQLPAPNSPVSLIRNSRRDSFKDQFSIFPLSLNPISIDTICNANVGTGTSILFNEECQDLLYICLYRDINSNLLSKSKDEVISIIDSNFVILTGKNCLVPDKSNTNGDDHSVPDDKDIVQVAKKAKLLDPLV